jgi:hypothetical protein
MEQAQGMLRRLVKGHLMFVFASLLRKRANALVHPLVTVDLGSLLRCRRRRCRDDVINMGLIRSEGIVSTRDTVPLELG